MKHGSRILGVVQQKKNQYVDVSIMPKSVSGFERMTWFPKQKRTDNTSIEPEEAE